jgi:RNA polymerase sigma factor (sigma-70 family)
MVGGDGRRVRVVAMAEREQFEACVLPHMAAMLRAAAALVGLAEAEDAAQEAMTRAWQAWPGLREVGAVRPWLLRITVNVCREWRRGSFGRAMEHTRPLQPEGFPPPHRWALPEAHVGTSDHTGALDLRGALGTLDEGLRTIVVLRYYGGMDATEVGQVLDMPPATVRTRLQRALGQLRERLGPRHPGTAPDARGGIHV